MVFTILEQIILGAIQGILEWIPISSSGFLTLILVNYFDVTKISELIRISLFLHMGTFLAAVVYFRKDLKNIFLSVINPKKSDKVSKKIFVFLFISTLITGTIGILIIKTIMSPFYEQLNLTGKTITLLISLLLFFTGITQLRAKKNGFKTEKDLKIKDSVFMGFMQGIAVIPGVSRSGITVSSLLASKFNETSALKLSFLMSLPIVLLGNIALNLNKFSFSSTDIYGLISAFIFGILTIHFLINLSKKIKFAWFVIVFSVLMMLSLFF